MSDPDRKPFFNPLLYKQGCDCCHCKYMRQQEDVQKRRVEIMTRPAASNHPAHKSPQGSDNES